MNPGSSIDYPKNQYKKFIKDVVSGTLERSELIEEKINSLIAKDINLNKTDKLLKIILFAARSALVTGEPSFLSCLSNSLLA